MSVLGKPCAVEHSRVACFSLDLVFFFLTNVNREAVAGRRSFRTTWKPGLTPQRFCLFFFWGGGGNQGFLSAKWTKRPSTVLLTTFLCNEQGDWVDLVLVSMREGVRSARQPSF